MKLYTHVKILEFTMDTRSPRVIAMDIQVISYLGDYLNMYKKSLERSIKKELSIQKSHVRGQIVLGGIASVRGRS